MRYKVKSGTIRRKELDSDGKRKYKIYRVDDVIEGPISKFALDLVIPLDPVPLEEEHFAEVGMEMKELSDGTFDVVNVVSSKRLNDRPLNKTEAEYFLLNGKSSGDQVPLVPEDDLPQSLSPKAVHYGKGRYRVIDVNTGNIISEEDKWITKVEAEEMVRGVESLEGADLVAERNLLHPRRGAGTKPN